MECNNIQVFYGKYNLINYSFANICSYPTKYEPHCSIQISEALISISEGQRCGGGVILEKCGGVRRQNSQVTVEGGGLCKQLSSINFCANSINTTVKQT